VELLPPLGAFSVLVFTKYEEVPEPLFALATTTVYELPEVTE
jgi:hypothetical protein